MKQALGVLESGEEVLFDSVAQVRLERWHQGRVVLLGDARGAARSTPGWESPAPLPALSCSVAPWPATATVRT